MSDASPVHAPDFAVQAKGVASIYIPDSEMPMCRRRSEHSVRLSAHPRSSAKSSMAADSVGNVAADSVVKSKSGASADSSSAVVGVLAKKTSENTALARSGKLKGG